MRGSRVCWATIDAIESDGLPLLPPLDQRWLLRRTVGLARPWEREPAVVLQGPMSASGCGAGVRAYEAAINEAARPRGDISQSSKPTTDGGGRRSSGPTRWARP